MKKLTIAIVAVVAVASASGGAWAQRRDGAPGARAGGGLVGVTAGAHRDRGWHGGEWRRGSPGWRGSRVGIYLGAPLLLGAWAYGAYPYHAPYPYYAPYRYSAPYPIYHSYSVVVEEPVYVQPAPAAPAPSPTYWYYCTDPAGYFPYVQSCSKPWMTVTPPGEPNPGAPAQ